VLSLTTPRTDDPLAGVVVPSSKGANPAAGRPSHLQRVYAELVAQLPVPDEAGTTPHELPALHSESDYRDYIIRRLAAWRGGRNRAGQA
jgi:phospholipase C